MTIKIELRQLKRKKMKLKNVKDINLKGNLKDEVKVIGKGGHKGLLMTAIVLGCLVFSICFLYQPAKDFYVSVREQDRLQAQYDALKNTTTQLQNDIDFLQTEEGIKQRASETLGLIQAGESIGYVAGSEIEDGRDNSAASTSSKLAYKNIKTPET